MKAIDLISSAVPTLSPLDSAGKALEWMGEFHANVLPMVIDGDYKGLMEEETLLEVEKDTLLATLPLSMLKPAIGGNVHFFEALKVVGDYQLCMLPVIDARQQYAGAITIEKLLGALSQFNGIKQEGGLLVLQMKPADYMLSEIARIAESENIILLGVHTITGPEPDVLKVLLKTNRQDLGTFVASLQQLNYQVVYRFDSADNTERLQKNYENLMNYINM